MRRGKRGLRRALIRARKLSRFPKGTVQRKLGANILRKIAHKRRGSTIITGRRKIDARRKFAKWLKKKDPFVYRLAIKRHEIKNQTVCPPKGLSGYDVDESLGSVWDSIAETIKQVAPTIAQLPYQKKMLDLQLKRAEKGLPPIDTARYAPAIKISPEITPESEAAITRVASDSIKTGINKLAIPVILGGLGLVYLLKKKRR